MNVNVVFMRRFIIGSAALLTLIFIIISRFVFLEITNSEACFFPGHKLRYDIEVCIDNKVWVLNRDGRYFFWVRVNGADPESFAPLPEVSVTGLYRDKNHVYAATDDGIFRVDGADPETVRRDPKGYKYCWSDKNARYCGAERDEEMSQ